MSTEGRLIVTPVKTGVHSHALNLDTVFQRYDGRLSVTSMPMFAGMTNFHFV